MFYFADLFVRKVALRGHVLPPADRSREAWNPRIDIYLSGLLAVILFD